MYTTIFDILGPPDRVQPPWGLYVAILLITLVIGGFAFHFLYRKGSSTMTQGACAVVLLLFCPLANFSSFKDFSRYADARKKIEQGRYGTAEGCLDSFHAGFPIGSRNPSLHEHWSLGGTEFSYSPGQYGPGYQTPQVINNRDRVRVAYVYMGDYGLQILRLQIMHNACPPTPDTWAR